MLQALRKSVTSWVGISILVLALGALVFTLFQPTGPASAPGASGPVMATVGTASVSESEFLTAVDRATRRERERQPEITQADFIGAGGGDVVFDQMVAQRAISEFAAANDMVVSPRVIDGEIASIPAAQVNGAFDEPTFRRLLASERLGEDELRRGIADDIKRRQLLAPVLASTSVPRGMAEPYAALLLEVRRGAILTVPSAAMPDPGVPTDAQLAAFHKENSIIYTIPERRAYRVAAIDPVQLADKAKPTEAEIAADYKARAGQFGGLETRDLEFLVLPDEAAARAFVQSVRGGKSFAAAAEAAGFSADDIGLGVRDREALAAELRPEAADAAFATKSVGVTDPVATPLGQYVFNVKAITAPAPQPLDSVRGTIEQRLATEKLEGLVADIVNDAEERLSGGEPLAAVAERHGLSIVEAPATTADGRVFADDLTVQRVEQPVLARVFAADPADGPQVADLGEGRFALFEVNDVVAPALVPVERIREDVALAWSMKAQSDAAKDIADRLAVSIGRNESLAPIVGNLRLPPPQPLAVRRLELSQMVQSGQEVPPPVRLLLSTPRGQARVVAAPGGQGWFVVAVEDVTPGNLAEAPQLLSAVQQNFRQQAADEMAATLVRAIERDLGVVRKPETLKAANQRITGALAE